MRIFVPPMYPQLICLGAVLLFLTPAYSQSNGGRSTQQDMQNREWALGHVREEVDKHFGRGNNLAPSDPRADFRQLQVVDNGLMKKVFVQKAIDPKEVRSALSEIKKLATRLKTSLTSSESGGQNAKTTGDSDEVVAHADIPNLPQGLLLLDQTVVSFVKNPMFSQAKVVDSTLGKQAERDLDEIVRLTGVLNGMTAKGPN